MKKFWIIIAGVVLIVAIVFGVCKLTSAPSQTPSGDVDNVDVQKDHAKNIRLGAYQMAIQNLLNNSILPNGEKEETDVEGYDMSTNQFAILDLDSDGKEELVLAMVHYPMAAMRTMVYEYDVETNEMKTQISDFPAMTFFDNGVLQVDASHNQGWAGDALWPYSLYKYNATKDSYDLVAIVDAWTKEIVDLQFNTGAKFPIDLDKDGDGVIYHVMPEGNFDMVLEMDNADYMNWRGQYITEDTHSIEMEYKNIIKENVDNIYHEM